MYSISRFLENCKYCLGCIGLRNQQYCILNKQYEKDEWFELVEKIFATMENTPLLVSSPQGEEIRDVDGNVVMEL